jgi:hypothetical protein
MLDLFIQAMQKHGIDCKYVNGNLIEVNRISVYINGNMGQFGTFKFRFSDIYDFVSILSQEDLIYVNTSDKFDIKRTFAELLAKSKVLE